MEAICIDSGPNMGSKPPLVEGRVYELIPDGSCCQGPFYLVPEIDTKTICPACRRELKGPKYLQRRFIPISEIDETQMERNIIKEKI